MSSHRLWKSWWVQALAGTLLCAAAQAATNPDVDTCIKADGDAALPACDSVIASHPSSDIAADAYYARGLMEDRKGQVDAAFDDYSKAIEYAPNFDYALHNRAMIYDMRGNYAAAIADFTEAIKANPIGGHFYNRARAYFHAGQYRNAANDDTVAEALWFYTPVHAYTLAARCQALAARGVDLGDAREDCENAVSSKPANPMYLTIRALVRYRQQDFSGAAADAAAAVAAPDANWVQGWSAHAPILEVQLADALYLKGLSEVRLGKVKDGQPDIAAAIRQRASVQSDYAKIGVAL
ncbi:MAG: tetratricopeptide repeat protein [Alphaproteobacteria bacterium]|nr:tetratricopeptide repeat protein [Alphaproteobacteria bacterium]